MCFYKDQSLKVWWKKNHNKVTTPTLQINAGIYGESTFHTCKNKCSLNRLGGLPITFTNFPRNNKRFSLCNKGNPVKCLQCT